MSHKRFHRSEYATKVYFTGIYRERTVRASQQPQAGNTIETPMGTPAWRSFSIWYMVASGDEVIPPDSERQWAARMDAKPRGDGLPSGRGGRPDEDRARSHTDACLKEQIPATTGAAE